MNGVKFGGTRAAPTGLTLLELVMVLVILSVVATAAVQALQPRVDNARFERTRAILADVQRAALGNSGSRQADGTPLLQGFVADVGCLPPAPSTSLDGSSQDPLRPLWDLRDPLAQSFPFRIRPGPSEPHDFSNVQLPCGWRGPYLEPGLGATSVRDGWGSPFSASPIDGEIREIVWQSPLDPEQQLMLDLRGARTVVSGNLVGGGEIPAGVEVYMLAPDPRSSLDVLRVAPDEDAQPQSFYFAEIPVGVRAVVVVVEGRQLVKYLYVPPGGLTQLIDITSLLPAPPDAEKANPAEPTAEE